MRNIESERYTAENSIRNSLFEKNEDEIRAKSNIDIRMFVEESLSDGRSIDEIYIKVKELFPIYLNTRIKMIIDKSIQGGKSYRE